MMAALLIAVPPLFQPLENSPGVEVRLPLDASSPLKKKVGTVSNDDGEGVFVVGLSGGARRKPGSMVHSVAILIWLCGVEMQE